MPNADSGGLNVRLRGGVAVGSGTCVDRIFCNKTTPVYERQFLWASLGG